MVSAPYPLITCDEIKPGIAFRLPKFEQTLQASRCGAQAGVRLNRHSSATSKSAVQPRSNQRAVAPPSEAVELEQLGSIVAFPF
jgi:hypothetical protein